jgi:hypothetical protein
MALGYFVVSSSTLQIKKNWDSFDLKHWLFQRLDLKIKVLEGKEVPMEGNETRELL